MIPADPIVGPVTEEAPFDAPGLVWRQTWFRPCAARSVARDGLVVALPADLRGAVPKRQAEFLAGRLCAGLALRAVGYPPDIPRAGRAPVWPAGIRGSIAHADGRAAAVVSDRSARLGLDIEPVMDDARTRELQGLIVSSGELALRPPGLGLGAFVTLAFSAKEAFYKAVSTEVGRVLEFSEVTLLAIAPGTLDLGFGARSHRVAWRIDNGMCLTLLTETAP